MGDVARPSPHAAGLPAQARGLESPESPGAPVRPELVGPGLLRLFTLLLLAGEPTHGFRLSRRLREAGLAFELDGLYRLLDHLEREGCVASRSSDRQSGVEGRIYRLTGAGVRELKAQAGAVERAGELVDRFCESYAQLVEPDDRAPSAPVQPTYMPDLPRAQSGADEGAVPLEQAGLTPRAVDRLRHAGVRSLQEIAVLTEWELRRQGLWVGDIRKIVAALAHRGLSLRDGTLGGPPRGADPQPPGEPPPPRRAWRYPQDQAAVRGGERYAAIVAARAEGDTLQEIADRFGLSRERIRQILPAGRAGDAASLKATRARRRLAAAETRREEVLAAWRQGSSLKRIATNLGLTQAAVQGVIARHATTQDRGARRLVVFSQTRASQHRHTNESLIEAVRLVAKESGHIPTRTEYAQTARKRGLPSLSTVENRFGGWIAALTAAGHPPTLATRRPYTRRWTEQSCQDALRALVAELGYLPSQSTYKQLAQARPDLPSSSTLRTRLGPWSAIAQRLQSQPALEARQ